jgi:hypothetical protein
VNNSIVRITFGSHLYGTSTPESDLDFKAVHLPDARDIVLQRASNSIKSGPEKAGGEKNAPGDVDQESYSLQRFLELLADGQTVAIDMLFAPDSAIISGSDLWDYIRVNRDRFLSKRSTAFLGYCRQQANKYGIKGSRVAAARAASEAFTKLAEEHPTEKVMRAGYTIIKLVEDHPEHCKIVAQAIGSSGEIGDFLEVCNRKVAYTATVRQAAEIFTRIYENYGARAKLAESSEGVDWKALSHAVRVGDEALELLQTGKVTFPLANAAHILDIKLGRLPYQQVADEIERLLEAVEAASQTSTLPDKADYKFIDHLVYDVYRERIVSGPREVYEHTS